MELHLIFLFSIFPFNAGIIHHPENDLPEIYSVGENSKNRTIKANLVPKYKFKELANNFRQLIDSLCNPDGKGLELIFLVDASSSVGADNFESELRFTKKVLLACKSSTKSSRVAIVTYSSVTNIVIAVDEITLNHNITVCGILTQTFLYSGGGTFTKGALLEANKMFANSNDSSNRIIFLLTDGFSNGGDPGPIAERLRENGILIYTFGLKSGNLAEMYKLSSSPFEQFSYILHSFQDFELLARLSLYSDLTVLKHEKAENESLCEEECYHPAYCACGINIGQYVCTCPTGFYLLNNTCLICPNGTYSSNGFGPCHPCPDVNHITIYPPESVDKCICDVGFESKNDTCLPLQCPSLVPPLNGIFVRDKCNTVINAGCGVRCNIGYILSGSSVRLCQRNGTWSGTPPVCKIKRCKLLLPPKNGNIICNLEGSEDIGLPVDSHCNFSCNEGYYLTGSYTRTCLPVAKWDGLVTKCKAIFCEKLNKPSNGQFEPESCINESQPYGSKCILKCGHGYKLEGPKYRTCTKIGLWTDFDKSTFCIDITPPTIECPPNMFLTTAPGENHTMVNWEEPKVSDNSDGSILVWFQPVLELPFVMEIGTLLITYVAMDSDFNQAVCNFTINVNDQDEIVMEKCESDTELAIRKGDVDMWKMVLNNGLSASHTVYKQEINLEDEFNVNAIDTAGNKCKIRLIMKGGICDDFISELNNNDLNGYVKCSELQYAYNCSLICKNGYSLPFINTTNEINFICLKNATSSPAIPHCVKNEESIEIIQEFNMKFPESESVSCDATTTFLEDIKEEISAACTSCSIKELECIRGFEIPFLHSKRKNRIIRQTNSTSNVLIHFKLVSNANENIVNQLMGQKKGFLSQYFQTSKGNISSIFRTEERCPLGKIKSGEHCLNCSIGWYHNVTADICSKCPDGKYQPMPGTTFCLPCNFSSNIITIKTGPNITYCKRICPSFKLGDTGKIYPYLQCEMSTYNAYNESYNLSSNYQIQYINNKSYNCISNPCTNGGSCVIKDQFLFCNCPTGYTGSICEIEMGPCRNRPCANGGTCTINLNNSKRYSCVCNPRHTGSQCEILIDHCVSSPCMSGGKCFNSIIGFKCICPPHINGLLCDQPPDFCLEEPCMEGSTCISGPSNYTCQCLNGWSGRHCEIDPCSNLPCKNGFCELNNSTYMCHCDEGYYGNSCEKEYSPCGFEPCLNNGTCITVSNNDYKCHCKKYYYGENCQHYIANFALHFQNFGVNDYAEISSDWEALNKISICFWLKVLGRMNYGTIFSYATKEVANAFTIVDSNGFVIFINGDYVTTNVNTIYGGWQSVCILWESNGQWKIYVEGNEIEYGTGLAPNGTIPGGGVIIIGQEQDSVGNSFNPHESFVGEISDLQVWDKLLSYEHIKEYSLCSGQKEGNVITWFQFLGNTHGMLKVIESDFCKKCDPPPSSIFTTIVMQEGGRNAVYHCNEGYIIVDGLELRNSTAISCLKHGKWQTPTPKCKPIQCGFPGYLPNGIMIGRTYVYPHQIFYKCREPYNLVGPAVRQCLSSGMWSGTQPTCQVGSCPKLWSPGHGSMWFNDYLAHFECNVGYIHFGESVLTCLNNNTWNYPVPLCIPKDCLSAAEGKMFSTTHINGTIVEITCEEGYNLTIDNSTVPAIKWDCKEAANFTKNWQCILDDTTCDEPLEPENGSFLKINSTVFERGSAVQIKCNKGFTIVGQNYTVCQGYNVWTHSNKTMCKRLDCGTPRRVPFAEIELLSDGAYKSIALVKCLPGYQGFGNLALKCQEDGRWSHFRGKCIRISCGKPQIPGGGIVYGHSYLFMDKVSVSCPLGFYLHGEETLTCSKDGKWDKTPICSTQPGNGK